MHMVEKVIKKMIKERPKKHQITFHKNSIFSLCLAFCIASTLMTTKADGQQPQSLSIGPEIYHLKRTREGGAYQSGTIYGGRINFDFIKRNKVYWGAQAFYATGTIDGKGATGSKIKSQWTDALLEGNIGYTLRCKESPHYSFTPFVGCGYLQETNQFKSPSPLHVKLSNYFGYLSYGFLSNVDLINDFQIGLNARFRNPWEPRCKISRDPDLKTHDQLIGDCFQYRIELPISYNLSGYYDRFTIKATPFYEARFYGSRVNFPFDFLKTKVRIIGGNVQLSYYF